MAWINVTQVSDAGKETVLVNSDTVCLARKPLGAAGAEGNGNAVLRFVDSHEIAIDETPSWWYGQVPK